MSRYFKDTNNRLHELPDDVDPATIPGFPQDAVEVTEEEAVVISNPPKTNMQKADELKLQLEEMERAEIMPRGAREGWIELCKQQGTAAGLTEPQLYAVNPFYRGLKDTNTIATGLRAQIRDLT